MAANLYVEEGYIESGYIMEGIDIFYDRSEIFIPRSEMLLLQTSPIEVRQLNLLDFHAVLRDIEDDVDGIVYPITHNYASATDVGGVSLAPVIDILEPYTVTFEDGSYAVNIVGGNTNLADRVNINNVGVRTSNSAGLQDLVSLQAASFDGGVAIDVNSIYSGTTFPVGTRGYPVNNLSDALSIAENRGLKVFFVKGMLNITTGDFSNGYTFQGDNIISSVITIADGADVRDCEFRAATVLGVVDNNNLIKQCAVNGVTHINGFMFECGLMGTTTLGGNLQATILNCHSAYATDTDPVIDLGGSGNNLALSGYRGDITVRNCSDSGTFHTLIMDGGVVTIDPTVTAGTVKIAGASDVIDNSTGTTVVQDLTLNTAVDNVPSTVWGHTTRELTTTSLDQADIHNALDTYTNKDQWQATDTDLTPVLTAIAALNDPTPAEIRAAFNAIEFQDKNTELEIHTWLDSYANKDQWQANSVNLTPVLDAISALNNLSLAQIEGSTVLAKETTLTTITTIVSAIPSDHVDLTPVLVAIGNLNDVTPAEVRAAFNAADFKDKNTELEVHTWLDTYTNKDNWKVDPQTVADTFWNEVV